MMENTTNEIAVISDIHGNSFALEEVLKDIKDRGIRNILNLGDSLYGPLDPEGTFELLRDNHVICISGNEDRIILENLDTNTGIITVEYVKSKLYHEIIGWLRALPFDLVLDDAIYCCHGSPQSDTEYLLEKLEPGKVAIREEEELDGMLNGIRQGTVLCGHSHVPRIVRTTKKLVVNAGSVGLPAYEDDFPIHHKMENHGPASTYIAMHLSGDSWKIDCISLLYDHEKAARLAESNGRPDWARWIRTGRAS